MHKASGQILCLRFAGGGDSRNNVAKYMCTDYTCTVQTFVQNFGFDLYEKHINQNQF